jgi:XTP/dITP diphosphohydrolase
MSELVLASGNAGKLAELQQALAPLNLSLRSIAQWTSESPDETGADFVDNALIKARHAAALTGLPSLADDSGLQVDFLQGAPGVHSARYAGPQATDARNNAKLLQALAQVEDADRGACFVCVIALVQSADDPAPLIARGEWRGSILRQPLGEGGFGYDPLFADPQLGRSSAQLSPAEKLARSHRGKAIAQLLQLLKDRA